MSRRSTVLLPLLLGACAVQPAEETPVPRPATPSTIMQMQLNSRAAQPRGPGIPGSEAGRLDGQRRLEAGRAYDAPTAPALGDPMSGGPGMGFGTNSGQGSPGGSLQGGGLR